MAPDPLAADLDERDVVAGGPQTLRHRLAAGHRDVVLGRSPAAQHGDLHRLAPGVVSVPGVVLVPSGSSGGVNLPTSIVTVSPGLISLPPCGSWALTTPSSSSVATSTRSTLTRKPASCRMFRASESVSPTTSGTSAFEG